MLVPPNQRSSPCIKRDEPLTHARYWQAETPTLRLLRPSSIAKRNRTARCLLGRRPRNVHWQLAATELIHSLTARKTGGSTGASHPCLVPLEASVLRLVALSIRRCTVARASNQAITSSVSALRNAVLFSNQVRGARGRTPVLPAAMVASLAQRATSGTCVHWPSTLAPDRSPPGSASSSVRNSERTP